MSDEGHVLAPPAMAALLPGRLAVSPPQEKGIDVALSVDFVMGAVKGSYDVGMIMSRDTDLRPDMETILTELHRIREEVVAWNQLDMDCVSCPAPDEASGAIGSTALIITR